MLACTLCLSVCLCSRIHARVTVRSACIACSFIFRTHIARATPNDLYKQNAYAPSKWAPLRSGATQRGRDSTAGAEINGKPHTKRKNHPHKNLDAHEHINWMKCKINREFRLNPGPQNRLSCVNSIPLLLHKFYSSAASGKSGRAGRKKCEKYDWGWLKLSNIPSFWFFW